MDWLTFVSNMTGALAWPAVVGAIAYFYRAELKQLFAGMKKLKLGPMEAEMFELRTRELRQLAVSLSAHTEPRRATLTDTHTLDRLGTAPAEPSAETSDFAQIEDELLGLAERTTPWGRNHIPILSAWNRVEDSLRSFADRTGADSRASIVTLLLELKRREAITPVEFDLLRQLYELRTEAAATTIGFSEDTVLNYVVAASSVLRKMGLSHNPGRSAQLRSVPLAVNVPDQR